MNYDSKKWKEFIILSALVHLIILYFVLGDIFMVKYVVPVFQQPVDVYVVEGSERQFVAIDDVDGDKETNENARYLSKVNRKVDLETRAKNWGSPKNVRSGIQYILKEDLDDAIGAYMKKKKKNNSGEKNEKNGDESSTYDYLPGVKPGDQTLLNTAEFVYYSFYRRVEEGIVYLWNNYVAEFIDTHPDVRANLGKRDYITEVEAVMKPEGDHADLVRTYVVSSSGVVGLDDIPGRAFAEASPFENPPDGMIEADGYIRMRWRFVVSVVQQIKYEAQPYYYNNDGRPDPALERNMYR